MAKIFANDVVNFFQTFLLDGEKKEVTSYLNMPYQSDPSTRAIKLSRVEDIIKITRYNTFPTY